MAKSEKRTTNRDSSLRLLILRLAAAAAVRVLVVDRILPQWPFQSDDQLLLGLVNGVILSEGLETMSDDLHPQHSVWDTIALGLALCVRLEFKAASRLLAVLSYGMQDNCCIAHWLAVIVLKHNKLEGGRLPGIVLLVNRHEQRRNEEHANDR